MFVASGLNYKTAPLAIREKIVLQGAAEDVLLQRLLSLPYMHEISILSTCNRTEIYCETDAPELIMPMLASEYNLPLNEFTQFFYQHQGVDAIKHTLRVSCGLDSMMLGEPQISGQMKMAYLQACKKDTVKKHLHQIFQYVFSASKRIRNQSGIGRNPISIASAAVQLIKKFFSDLKPLNIFIIGSGEMASLVVKYLQQQGATNFMIANRTQNNAIRLANTCYGHLVTISDIPQYLPKADLIVSATTCPLPFITQKLVKQSMIKRNNAPMFILDLAVPRDVETNVAEIENVQLYNVDDLKSIVAAGMDQRRAAAAKAEVLVGIEVEQYTAMHRSKRVATMICDYREKMQNLAQQELQRAIQRLSAGDCQYNVLNEFCNRLVKKLTHKTTVGLRQAALHDNVEILELAHSLFTTSPQVATQ